MAMVASIDLLHVVRRGKKKKEYTTPPIYCSYSRQRTQTGTSRGGQEDAPFPAYLL